MSIPGLVSISFRNKRPGEIIALCVRAGLKAIEWGGDVHVPPSDPAAADQVRRMTVDSGLITCSYGSYFRAGQPIDDFRRNLEAAAHLGAPIIRIWAGTAGSSSVGEVQRRHTADQLVECAYLASAEGMRVALEYHGGTLTDERRSVLRLMDETRSAADKLLFYWQPRWDWPEDERLRSLDDVRPRLSHIHAFSWAHQGEKVIRLPLSEGERTWQKALAGLTDRQMVLLEFVEDDSDEALLRDALTLREWIARHSP